jgi:hypothetical protein
MIIPDLVKDDAIGKVLRYAFFFKGKGKDA